VNIVLVAYGMILVTVNFDTSVGLVVGVDF
jgi:hypothetical protein